jgi:hypothetical protein
MVCTLIFICVLAFFDVPTTAPPDPVPFAQSFHIVILLRLSCVILSENAALLIKFLATCDMHHFINVFVHTYVE